MTNLSTKALVVRNIKKNRSAAEKELTPAQHKKAWSLLQEKGNEKSAINLTHFSTYTSEVSHSESQSFVCASRLYLTDLSKGIQLKRRLKGICIFLTESVSVHPGLITPMLR